MKSKAHVTKKNDCPICKHSLDRASYVDTGDTEVSPTSGDITICAYCSALLVFTDDLGVRIAKPEDTKALSNEHLERIRVIQSAVAGPARGSPTPESVN